jgi:hypothetical protein
VKNGSDKPPEFSLIHRFYPLEASEHMRTLQNEAGAFRKVGECLYRYSSNGVYYARFKANAKSSGHDDDCMALAIGVFNV